MRTDITYSKIKNAYKKKGYKFFDGTLNINFFAIRDKSEKIDDTFDCTFGIAYQLMGGYHVNCWPGTTLPGKYWMKNFFNKAFGGAAIMVPGQYLSAFIMGKQWGKDALIQRKPIPVYRDGNKDDVYDRDPSKIMTGIFSTNIHRAGMFSKIIDKWSAGCQVFQKNDDFELFWYSLKLSADIYGKIFTYTLFTDDEVK